MTDVLLGPPAFNLANTSMPPRQSILSCRSLCSGNLSLKLQYLWKKVEYKKIEISAVQERGFIALQ